MAVTLSVPFSTVNVADSTFLTVTGSRGLSWACIAVARSRAESVMADLHKTHRKPPRLRLTFIREILPASENALPAARVQAHGPLPCSRSGESGGGAGFKIRPTQKVNASIAT